jgi:large subunit ribosomal protein L7/L12
VEGAPKPIKEGVTKQEAEEIKKKVEAAGAKVEIK